MPLQNSLTNNKSNLIINRSIRRMYPAVLVSSIALMLHYMIDSSLAGFFFDPQHIAAVGVASPAYSCIMAVMNILLNGSIFALSINMGRGNKENCSRMYSLFITSVLILSGLSILCGQIFAVPIVKLFGASTQELISLSTIFFRANIFVLLTDSLAYGMDLVMCAYGYAGISLKMSIIRVLANIGFSAFYIKVLNTGFIGLSLGTMTADIISFTIAIFAIKTKKIPLKYNPFIRFKKKELVEATRLGFPINCDWFIESFVYGIANNIIVVYLGEIGISYFAVVLGLINLLYIPINASLNLSTPLYGLLYGAHDKNGLKRAFGQNLWVSMIITVVWGIILYFLLPLLIDFYGMSEPSMAAIIRTGFYFGFILVLVFLLAEQMAALFEATDRFILALVFSVTSDSVLFLVILAPLVASFGYNGLWSAQIIGYLIFFLCFYIILVVKNKTLLPKSDDFLLISDSLNQNIPKIDISIESDNTSVSKIAVLVQDFLAKENVGKRTSYMTALCVEELASDFVEHLHMAEDKADKKKGENKVKEVMDIKLFHEGKKISVLIRNAAPYYNPLDFTLDKETFSKIGVSMVQKVAKKIEFNYMFRMNVVSIEMEDD